jgi:hypothetical protein
MRDWQGATGRAQLAGRMRGCGGRAWLRLCQSGVDVPCRVPERKISVLLQDLLEPHAMTSHDRVSIGVLALLLALLAVPASAARALKQVCLNTKSLCPSMLLAVPASAARALKQVF